MVSKLLFRLSRNRYLDRVVCFGFANLSALLPVQRVCETEDVIAFHHPRPSWKRHILFVPKVAIPSLRDVKGTHVPVVRQLIVLALGVASREHFKRDGYAILANGGAYQDGGQLHVHLVSPARERSYDCPDAIPADVLLETDVLTAFHHPRPRRSTHVVMLARHARSATEGDGGFDNAFVDGIIGAIPALLRTPSLGTAGYTLLIGARPGPGAPGPCVHLVRGGELS